MSAPTIEQLIAELRPSYELIYVDYRDQLSDEQVAHLVRGDFERLWESLEEFEWQARADGAANVARDILEDAGISPDDFQDYSELIEAIEERDSSDWVRQLARQTPDVLLRINVIDEDHAYSFEGVEPKRVLADVSLPTTNENQRIMGEMLAECSPEFSVLFGYWIVGADVEALYDLSSEADVEIENPYLYLGNPFAGSGFISEEPLQGTISVKRSELRTDRDAFGYAVDEVYGGLSASSFECTLRAAERTARAGD